MTLFDTLLNIACLILTLVIWLVGGPWEYFAFVAIWSAIMTKG